MTMEKLYEMPISHKLELRKKVEKLGQFLREEWLEDSYRPTKVYKYEGQVYYIDSYHGIIDIMKGV